MESAMPKVSIVLPCLNEGSHLETTLETIADQLKFLHGNFEFVIVDDGSTDNTWEVVSQVASETNQVRGLKLSRRFGKELAITAGLEHAQGQAVILMDADLQHPPSVLPEMVRLWELEGYEIVEAVKEERGGESIVTRAGAHFFGVLYQRMCKIDLSGASDFKLMDRKVVDAWAAMPERNVFFRGMNAWLGFRRKRLPFSVAPRAGGKTNWSRLELTGLALTGITAFSSIPIHLVTWMGVLFMFFAFLQGLFTLVAWLAGEAVEGFTTVIILQLLIASMIMISLGIIGTYISRIYDEVKGRPRFILSDTISPKTKTNPEAQKS